MRLSRELRKEFWIPLWSKLIVAVPFALVLAGFVGCSVLAYKAFQAGPEGVGKEVGAFIRGINIGMCE